jgi:hypothetical protein
MENGASVTLISAVPTLPGQDGVIGDPG